MGKGNILNYWFVVYVNDSNLYNKWFNLYDLYPKIKRDLYLLQMNFNKKILIMFKREIIS